MDGPTVIKLLVNRERELDRKRTRALARQQWGDVIDLDARIDECRRLRGEIGKEVPSEPDKPTPK